MLEIHNHWIQPARRYPSPNQDQRPQPPEKIDLLVLHAMSLPTGEWDSRYVTDLFLNQLDWDAHPQFDRIRGLKVSAHLVIDRLGGLAQYVAFDRRAWHAGESQFEGRTKCNDFSIGIELIGCDDQPFTDRQYVALAQVSRVLFQHYPGLAPDRVRGHSEIAPGRKTDPGPHFDWKRFRRSVAQGL